MKRCLMCILAMACLLPLAVVARADEPITVALEKDRVDITPDFAGTALHAFGAFARTGDVVIKVIGPEQDVTLTREVKYGPFWVNGRNVQITGAPSLLYLYASRPLSEIYPREQKTEGVQFEPASLNVDPHLVGGAAGEGWRKAFFRLKRKERYYRVDDHAIKVIGNRLFVADIPLPGSLELGDYQVETLLVQSGKIIGRNVTHFEVRQVGMERWVWNIAQRQPWLFGSAFTLCCMVLGFSLNALFHRHQ